MELGDRLKEIRLSKGLKQSELAEEIDVSTSNISRIEKNEISPSANTLLHICKYFAVSADWLLTGEGSYNIEIKEIQKISPFEKLPVEERMLLNNYRKMDDDTKEKLQDMAVQLIRERPQSKLSSSEDEMSADLEAAN